LLTGGSVITLASGVGTPLSLAVDSSYVFFGTETSLMRAPN
jgi:hypothetical protein